MNEQNDKNGLTHRVFTIIGILMCIVLIPVLIINITLIAKSYINKDDVPSFGGYLPLIVLTDSMYPDINSGDLIICRTTDPESIKVDDVIAFFDPDGNGTSVVTHKVIEILNDDGLKFRTKGINNNAADKTPVPAKNLVGVYKSRIPGAGNIAMFMQTTVGLLVCVVLPLILLVGYDLIRRRRYDIKNRKDTDALLAELQALKEEKAKASQLSSASDGNSSDEPHNDDPTAGE